MITRPVLYLGGPPASPTVAEPSPVQTTLPTSAYGQTIPVVWGKARLPAAYIWVAPILTVTETHMEWFDQVTTTTSAMTARLRFARPLVPNSTWGVRRIWAQGKLIYDSSTGYRAPGVNFRVYDGRSTQGRDPSQVSEEGTNNVSAHRGYLDIVFRNFDIFTIGSPPVFEAEWIQDPSTDPQVENFQTFFSDPINTVAAADWDAQEFYGVSNDSGQIRRFSISGLREIYAIAISGLGRAYSGMTENFLAYVPIMDRLVAFGFVPGPAGGTFPIMLDPVTGTSISEGAAIGDAGQLLNAAAVLQFGHSSGLLIASSFHIGYFSVFRFDANTMTRVSLSGSFWDSRGLPESITVGTIRDSDADVYVCAGTSLYKLVINAQGLVLTTTTLATFSDNLRYVVFYDSNLIVWNDNAQAIKVGGTGATIWTVTVPYQLPAASAPRGDGDPTLNRFDDTFFTQDSDHYYFTNLDDGTTETVSKPLELSPWRHVYDAISDTVITTDNFAVPQRRRFNVSGTGDLRNLSDFLSDLMIHGGGEDEVDCINIDDQIQGAVIDVTAGARDIARSTIEPYSIAMFER
ncbi:hypothetical protein LB557_24705 [Mesorhizobium sp. BR115XR7A]|uniref:hypothetical protein n=1 Tax=Mesorhizobium sp. BR115XR7A TaxID=2876645 RepID=UPI001CD04A59|nr:hypothetical protein [Mesorhizobium sp. BR115XR7A]MBZ9909215.1 hypothetical protein [Mesorhizobium sp. BR115XR7A]